MTESHGVVTVRGPSARSGPHQLDRGRIGAGEAAARTRFWLGQWPIGWSG
jgi:hypothetical protein